MEGRLILVVGPSGAGKDSPMTDTARPATSLCAPTATTDSPATTPLAEFRTLVVPPGRTYRARDAIHDVADFLRGQVQVARMFVVLDGAFDRLFDLRVQEERWQFARGVQGRDCSRTGALQAAATMGL